MFDWLLLPFHLNSAVSGMGRLFFIVEIPLVKSMFWGLLARDCEFSLSFSIFVTPQNTISSTHCFTFIVPMICESF